MDRTGAGCAHVQRPSGDGSAVALPSRMVHGVEGFGPSLSGTFAGGLWGLIIVCPEECGQVFPPLDCLADGSSARCFRHCGRRAALP